MKNLIKKLDKAYWQRKPHEPLWQRRESKICALTFFDCQLCGFTTFYTVEFMTRIEGKFDYGKDLRERHSAK